MFVVTECFMTERIPQYKLKDYDGEIITGTFYENQLSRVYEQEVYFINKILKMRKKAGKEEYVVRWKGGGHPSMTAGFPKLTSKV